ncbi:MAG TPA: DinB family protein [Bryobacteraceae bacterium]|nr:DinB family protein [Bryobacteraceae bacterium]
MTHYGGHDLARSFLTVRKNTIKIAEEIPEEHYAFRAAPDTRTVAQTLAHIAFGPMWADQFHSVERRTTMVGFDFPGFFSKIIAEEHKPRSKAELLSLLQSDGDRLAKWMDGLSDDFLAETVTFAPGMTPPGKSRFEMILGLKEHEMHHRAQLMLMQRLLGIVPHMTREMQARMAQMQATKASAS